MLCKQPRSCREIPGANLLSPLTAPFYPGTDFGFDYDYETNYRDLKGKFAEDPDSENWVLLPIVPYNAYENDFVGGRVWTPAAEFASVVISWATDNTGRGYSGATFLRISLCGWDLPWHTCLIVFVIGIAVGCAMGYFGGSIDLFGQRVIEIWQNIPLPLHRPLLWHRSCDRRLVSSWESLSVFGWTSMTYYMRTETLREKSRDYVASAKVLGASNWAGHFSARPAEYDLHSRYFHALYSGQCDCFPDCAGFPWAFGLPVPTPSWGELLQRGVQNLNAPWIVTLGVWRPRRRAPACYLHRGGHS